MLFELRFTTKQLERYARKAEKEQKLQQGKVKLALQKGNVESARIYAENAIRKKNEGLTYLRFASKVDAVSSRVKTAQAMNQVTRNMSGVVKMLDKVLKSMDLEKTSKVMDQFEKEFEDLDVHSSVMEGTMSAATALSTPTNQVDDLIRQVAEENGLDVAAALPSVADTVPATAQGERTFKDEEKLDERWVGSGCVFYQLPNVSRRIN